MVTSIGVSCRPALAEYGKTRRRLKRVQMRGGARRPHARRTFCTLSVRPRAPTKQMGPFQPPALELRVELAAGGELTLASAAVLHAARRVHELEATAHDRAAVAEERGHDLPGVVRAERGHVDGSADPGLAEGPPVAPHG